MKVQDMIDVLVAYRNQDTIQANYKNPKDDWRDVSLTFASSDFDFVKYSYRVKPEPREFYLRTKDQIRWEGALTDDCNPVEGSIKVVEVIE